MAAILKLRRGTTIPSLAESELFYHTSAENLLVGVTGSSYITLVKLDDLNNGTLQLSGDITASNARLSGDIVIGGNIYLGDTLANDNISVNASFSGSLIPSASNEYDLGSSTKKWKNLWAVSASIDNLTVGGSGILSSSATNFTDYSESVDLRLDNSELTGSNHRPRIVDLESTGSDHETRIDEIETTFSSSVDSRLDYLEGDFSSSVDNRLDLLETDTGSQDFRLDRLEEATASLDSRLDNVELTTASFDDRITDLESTGSDHESRIDELEGPFSTSVDSRLDALEIDSASLDSRYLEINGDNVVSSSQQISDYNVFLEINGMDVVSGSIQIDHDQTFNFSPWEHLDHRHLSIVAGPGLVGGGIITQSNAISVNAGDGLYTTSSPSKVHVDATVLRTNGMGVVSGSDQILGGTGILSSSNEDFSTFSSSIDNRVNEIETTFSSSVDSRLDYLEGDFSSSVDGTLDGLTNYTSSLRNAIYVDGNDVTVFGDLTVQGDTTTLNTSTLVVEDKQIVIASGSSNNADADGAGIYIDGANSSMFFKAAYPAGGFLGTFVFDRHVSSSLGFIGDGSRLTNLTADTASFGILSDLPTLVSSSDQISFTEIVDKPTLVSGSQQVIDLLPTGVVSGSSQITITESQISDLSHTDISSLNTFTSSIQSEVDSLTAATSSYESIGSGIVSSSAQVTELLPSGVISGSSQITITESQISDLSHYTDSDVKTKLDSEGVLSGSLVEQLPSGTISGSAQTIANLPTGTVSGSAQTIANLPSGVVSGSTQTIANLPTGVISGSEQVDYNEISNVPQNIISASSFSSNGQGEITASVNETSTSFDLGLTTSDSPTFASMSLSTLSNFNTSVFDAVFKNGNGTLGYRTLGNAAFYNVSSSIGDDPNSIPTNKAVSDALIAAGAGDITAVNDSSIYSPNNTGLVHTGQGTFNGGYGKSGNVVMAIDTGSTHFQQGVELYSSDLSIPSGTISGSQQVIDVLDDTNVHSGSYLGTATTTNLDEGSNKYYTDDRVKAKLNAEGVLSGSIDLSQIHAFTSSADFRISSLESFTASLDDGYVTQNELASATGALETVNNNQNNRLDALQGATSSLQNTDLEHSNRLDSLESETGSIETEQLVQDSRLDSLESFTGSLDASYVTQVELALATGALENADSVQNGRLSSLETATSSYEIIGSGILSSSNENFSDFSQSVDLRIDTIEAFNGSDRLNSLELFTSSQETKNLNLQSYTASVDVSLSELNSFTSSIDGKFSTLSTYTSSVDNSINSLNAVSHSHSNKSNLDTINQDLSKTDDVEFASFHTSGTGSIGTNLVVYGDLTVLGTETIINTTNLAIEDNMIYLNSGSTVTNPDLGWAGNYNDGSYAHAGMFRDASDGRFKVYDGYTPEPEGSIDTSHASFNLGDFQADNVYTTYIHGDGSNLTNLPASQITLGGDVTGNANSNTVGKIQGVVITSGEANQIANIDTTTISSTQWGYLGALNQGLTTTSTVQFGKVGVGGASDATYELKVIGDIGATGDIVGYISSDKRLKDNIQPISEPISKINQISGNSFIWNEEKQNIYKGKDYGVIAQEIEEILPELVETRENGYKAVKYDRIVSLLIEGIKELSKEVDELKKKIN